MPRNPFAVTGALLIILAASIVLWRFWPSTPEYTLMQIERALKNRDVALFKRYADVEGMAARLYDDLAGSAFAGCIAPDRQADAAPDAKISAPAAGRDRTAFCAEANRAVETFVETGRLDPGGLAGALIAVLKLHRDGAAGSGLGGDAIASRFKGCKIETQGKTAFLDILLAPGGHDGTVTARLVMKEREGSWRLERIDDPTAVPVQVAALDLKAAQALTRRASLAIETKDYAEALQTATDARRYVADYAPALLAQGRALSGLTRHGEAIPLLRKAAEDATLGASPWYALGLAQRLSGSPDCIASFEKANALAPDGDTLKYAILLNLGVALMDAERAGEARLQLIEASLRDESQAAPLLLLGMSFLNIKGSSELERYLKRAASKDSAGKYYASVLLADYYLKFGFYHEKSEHFLSVPLESSLASETLLEGVTLKIDRGDLFRKRAELRLKFDDISGAYADFEQAEKLVDNFSSPMEATRVDGSNVLYVVKLDEPHYRAKVYHNNTQIWGDDFVYRIEICNLFTNEREWATILVPYAMGTLCETGIRILFKHSDEYFITEDIGRCTTFRTEQTPTNGKLQFNVEFPEYYETEGKVDNLTITFNNGVVYQGEKRVSLEALYVRKDLKPYFPGLKQQLYHFEHPLTVAAKIPELGHALKHLFSNDEEYGKFTAYISNATEITLEDDRYIVGNGCVKSACGILNGIYVADLFTGKVYAATWDSNVITYYGCEDNACLPAPIRQWNQANVRPWGMKFVPPRNPTEHENAK